MNKEEIIIVPEAAKSILNRILLISTMMEAPLDFSGISSCADVRTMITNMEVLGYRVEACGEHHRCYSIGKIPDRVRLRIEDAGAVWRFLMARMVCWENMESTLEISEQLEKRPIKVLLDSLRELGAEIDSAVFPVVIRGKKLVGGEISIRSDVSSQFVSALLLVSPLFEKGLRINLTGKPVSASYIKMTMKVMQDFGVTAEWQDNRISVESGQSYHYRGVYQVEPDYSSACYFWTMGALSSRWICTVNQPGISVQPDYGFLDVLRRMGAEVKMKENWICLRRKKLQGIKIDMRGMPDQVPTLAFLAIFADSPVRISGIEHLRHKESDRISSILQEMRKLEIKADYESGVLTIYPDPNFRRNAVLSSHNDHRIAMGLHLIRFMSPEITISGTGCIAKSYVGFSNHFSAISV